MAQRAHLPHRSLLQELRQQTTSAHEQLHHHTHFVALFEQKIELPHYRDLLSRFHGFYAVLDDAIAQSMNVENAKLAGYSYAKRTGFLTKDLSALGFTSSQIAQNPKCTQLFKVVSPASLAGVLYVIEGSTLGAAQIDRAAMKLLSNDTLEGRQFWAWSRAHNKSRWAMILSYLATLDVKGAAQDPIINGANATFQALADWLAPLDHPVALSQEAIR